MGALEDILGAGGTLARALSGYEDRPSQLRMAAEVSRALREQRYLLVEAGTGTGKTLAYLVPALLSGRKVVVSTATKTLQDQIFYKDLPLLAREGGMSFRAAYMKGRANYLCLARYERFEQEPAFESRQETRLFPRIKAWARSTEVGDRAELDLPESFATWRELSATAETCTGQRCPDYDRCFVTKMRQEALEADLVIVNHHLFFADLALRTARGGGRGGEVIPRYDAVIFDEAHALEDVATDHFGVQLSTFRVDDLCRDAEQALAETDLWRAAEPQVKELGRAARPFFEQLAARSPAQGEAVRVEPRALAGAAMHANAMLGALDGLRAALAEEETAEAAAIGRRAGELAEDLRFLAAAEDPRFVYFTEQRARGAFLRACPVDVAQELAERLYRALDTAVFTSATLSAAGSFDYVTRRLGLLDEEGRPRVELASASLPSPFDYPRQALLYLPSHLPEPQDPLFAPQAAEEIERLCAITHGRAFVLCTALRQMAELHRVLRHRLPHQVLLQGELPKAKLLAKFKERASVLFASASFWEGVDVPGDALSLVVIDKLPFANPRDPVVSARIDLLRRQGAEPFSAYQVPQAALALRQGFGRLIRTRADRGIVAVLDRRVATKGYGQRFLASLPKVPRFDSLVALERAWHGVRGPLPDS